MNISRKLLALLALLSAPAWAQIAVEGTPNGDIDSGDSYAPETGTNRVVVWPLGFRVNNVGDETISSGSYNSVSLVIPNQAQRTVGSNSYGAAILHALEANLPGGSSAITATPSAGSLTDNDGAGLTLSGVDQTTAVEASVTASGGGLTSLDLNSLAVTDGGIAIFVASSNRDMTLPSGYTQLFNETATANNPLAGYKLITSTGTESISITLASSGAASGVFVSYSPAPSTVEFSSGPTVAAATNGYTISGTITNEDATVYAAGLNPGATAPADCTAIQALSGSAPLFNSELWTADSADSFALAAAGAHPRHDVYICADTGTNETAVTSAADENRSADASQAITVTSSIGATSIFALKSTDGSCDITGTLSDNTDVIVEAVTPSAISLESGEITGCADTSWIEPGMLVDVSATTGSNIDVTQNAYFSPTVAAGDVIEGDTTNSEGDSITVASDGDISYTDSCGGCLTTWDFNIQDVSDASDGDFDSGPPNWSAGDDTLYFFNEQPDFDLADIGYTERVLPLNSAMTSIELAGFCIEENAQDTSFAIRAGTIPTGVSLDGDTGVISGTATVENESGVTLDITCGNPGNYYDHDDLELWVVGTVAMPDLVGSPASGAVSTLETSFPWRDGEISIDTLYVCRTQSETAGDVTYQNPSAGAEVGFDATFQVDVARDITCAELRRRRGP